MENLAPGMVMHDKDTGDKGVSLSFPQCRHAICYNIKLSSSTTNATIIKLYFSQVLVLYTNILLCRD